MAAVLKRKRSFNMLGIAFVHKRSFPWSGYFQASKKERTIKYREAVGELAPPGITWQRELAPPLLEYLSGIKPYGGRILTSFRAQKKRPTICAVFLRTVLRFNKIHYLPTGKRIEKATCNLYPFFLTSTAFGDTNAFIID